MSDDGLDDCGEIMCRLLGIIANNNIAYPILLKQFAKQFSTKNPHGWGFGWYENSKAHYFKEGLPAHDPLSQYNQYADDVQSPLIIAHVRELSEARPAEKNSHPFQVDNWLFIHNGFVDGKHLQTLLDLKYKELIVGDTDSEIYFYWILQNIENYNNDVLSGIKSALKEVIKKRYTGINFLLSDGSSLYAFRYSQNPQDKYTLYTRNHNSMNSFDNAILICSEPITNEEWVSVNFGSMVIVNNKLEIHEEPIIDVK